MVLDTVEGIRRQESLDLIIVNAENADGGSGLTPAIYRKLVAAGVDCITLGDHIYKKKDIIEILESESNIEASQLPCRSAGAVLDNGQVVQQCGSRSLQLDRSRVHETSRLPVSGS